MWGRFGPPEIDAIGLELSCGLSMTEQDELYSGFPRKRLSTKAVQFRTSVTSDSARCWPGRCSSQHSVARCCKMLQV